MENRNAVYTSGRYLLRNYTMEAHYTTEDHQVFMRRRSQHGSRGAGSTTVHTSSSSGSRHALYLASGSDSQQDDDKESATESAKILVSMDGERYVPVHLTGAPTASYIRQRVFDRVCTTLLSGRTADKRREQLYIPDDERDGYSVYMVRGSLADNKALTDTELRQNFDECGNGEEQMKLLVARSDTVVHAPLDIHSTVHLPGELTVGYAI